MKWTDTRGGAGSTAYEDLKDRGVSLGTASLALGDDRGESGDEALAGAWWRCGDVEIAAEYLYAAAHEN